MFKNIDYSKLIEQDPDFKNYIAEVIAIAFDNKDETNLVALIHDFYQSGITSKQTGDVIRSNQRRSE